MQDTCEPSNFVTSPYPANVGHQHHSISLVLVRVQYSYSYPLLVLVQSLLPGGELLRLRVLYWKHSGQAPRYSLLGTRVGQAHEHVRLQSNHEYVSLKPVPHEKVGCPTRKLAFCSKLATRSRTAGSQQHLHESSATMSHAMVDR